MPFCAFRAAERDGHKYENKRLKMEVELLRDFLSLIGKE